MKLIRSIVMVGLMGAGKTSVGRRLAERLDARFHDCDDEIVAAAGMSIPEIFEKFGEEEFRRGERAVLERLLEGPPGVISTGGGAFMNAGSREIISRRGTSVWLCVELDVLWARVADKPGRPLLASENPYETLKGLLNVRYPVYALADVTVHSDFHNSQDEVAGSIVEALLAFGRGCPDKAVFEEELNND